MSNTTNFSKRLKERMTAKGISQKELASMIGMGKSSVSQYLSGKNIPNKAVQARIAEALGCTVDDLHSLQITGKAFTYSEAKAIVTRRELQEYISVLPDSAIKALKPMILLLVAETPIDETNLTREEVAIVSRGRKENEKVNKT